MSTLTSDSSIPTGSGVSLESWLIQFSHMTPSNLWIIASWLTERSCHLLLEREPKGHRLLVCTTHIWVPYEPGGDFQPLGGALKSSPGASIIYKQSTFLQTDDMFTFVPVVEIMLTFLQYLSHHVNITWLWPVIHDWRMEAMVKARRLRGRWLLFDTAFPIISVKPLDIFN